MPATKEPSAAIPGVDAILNEALGEIAEAQAYAAEATSAPQMQEVAATDEPTEAATNDSGETTQNTSNDASDDSQSEDPASALSKKERREAFAAISRARARTQKRLGKAELEKLYPGVVVAPVHIELHDFNISSSAQRFLGLVDKTLHLVNRAGSQIMSDSEVDATRKAIIAKINEYVEEAKAADAQGRALVQKEKDKTDSDMWLEPRYSSATLVTDFGVKVREVVPLIKAIKMWDQSLLHFATLDFNGAGDVDQIDTLRRRERHLFGQINMQCLRTIGGFGKRAQNVKRVMAAPHQDAAAPQD